jgi:hypothetical protein
MKKLLPLLAILLLGAIALQQRAVHRLRAEQASLNTAPAGESPAGLGEPASQSDVADEIARLKQENQELLQLRNEVRQLRDRQAEFAKVRAENQRLRAAAAGVTQPGLIKAEAFANAGLSSPEATVQTAFWALQSGNETAYRQCMAPSRERRLRPDDFARWSTNFSVGGFKIETSQMVTPDEIGLAVRVYHSQEGQGDYISKDPGGQEGPVTLKKVGEEWKIEKATFPILLPGL